jgi:threonine dehydratase
MRDSATPTLKRLPTPDDARAARERVKPYVRRTPVTEDDGTTYKLEFLQVTGSFKPRGAFNAMLQLDPAQRECGVVAFSGGNHGLAVAYVGNRLGIRTSIFMPETTPAPVIERARADSAEVVLAPTIADAMARVEERIAAGQQLIHPYDDERVMAGQAMMGLELLEDIPDLETLVVSIGGGGLIAGVASVIKALKPSVKIYGVETRGADAMRKALDAGKPVTLPAITSIARTLGAPIVCATTLHAAQTLLDDVVSVEDADAVRSILALQRSLHVTVEPASSVGHAALQLGLVPRARKGTTAVVVCGGNVDIDEIVAWRDTILK